MTDYAVWWLSQQDCEWLSEVFARGLMIPVYIREQFDSRKGRPGRGRLWLTQYCRKAAVDPWPEDAPMAKIAERCGGIVLKAKDAHFILPLPGFVTDLQLKPWAATPRDRDGGG